MLQQTQVETVLRAYAEWMRVFPDLKSLAAAEEEQVLALWSGLGYYRRARNLRQAARLLWEQGHKTLPATRAELLAMPGVGAYTAGAILSLAFGQNEPILDGNVIRVLSRFHGLPFLPDQTEGKAVYWAAAAAWAADAEPWSINEALMELGALICTPRSPRCGLCPLAPDCIARVENKTEALPPAKARAEMVMTPAIAVVLESHGHILLVNQPESKQGLGTKMNSQTRGLLKGHWLFPMLWHPSTSPSTESELTAQLAEYLPKGAKVSLDPEAGHVSHTITHHKVEVVVRKARVTASGKPQDLAATAESRWVQKSDLPKALVPSLAKKIWSSYLGLAQQRKPITRLA